MVIVLLIEYHQFLYGDCSVNRISSVPVVNDSEFKE